MSNVKMRVKRIHPDAILPKYATPGAACFDLHAIGPIDRFYDGQEIGEQPVTIETGLAFEVPENHVMLIFSRSGHGFKHDTRLANCVGVIDSDYRGEVKVRLTRDGSWETRPLSVRPGDRVAQAMLIPLPTVDIELADELSTTERGAGGFGSTGS